jgi:hypothetical protein
MTAQQQKQNACLFAQWVFSHCELHPSGWMVKYGFKIYNTIEELYDFWYKNIKQ